MYRVNFDFYSIHIHLMPSLIYFPLPALDLCEPSDVRELTFLWSDAWSYHVVGNIKSGPWSLPIDDSLEIVIATEV